MNQLRPDFGAAHRPDCHDKPEAQIDIAESAMPLRGHDGFPDDVRQVRSDREIPIQTHRAQGWAGDETSTDSEKTSQDANDEADHSQVNGADLRVGDREQHRDHSERPPRSRRINQDVRPSSKIA